MALKYFFDQNSAVAKGQSMQSISAKQIADATHAPYEVVARVLQALSARGILKAEYGVTGGYQLIKKLSDVSIYELMETLESSTELAKCLGTDGECDMAKTCTIVSPVTNLNRKVQEFYKSLTLDEVLHV